MLINCRNEESSIALVLRDIPVELNATIVVVDNGSIDETVRVARESVWDGRVDRGSMGMV